MPDHQDPHEALASIKDAKSRLAQVHAYPVGWDVAYGLICGGLVAGQGLEAPWGMLVLTASLLGLAFMVRAWRNRTGWWISGYSPRRARWVAFGLAAVLVGLIGLVLWFRFNDGPGWVPFAAGAAAAVAAAVGGRVWLWVWRRELEA